MCPGHASYRVCLFNALSWDVRSETEGTGRFHTAVASMPNRSPTRNAPSFLLPALSQCFVTGLFRSWNAILFALRLILRFISRMIPAINADSKLCACATRHTSGRRLSAARLRSTWQEEGKALPVASPPLRRKRRAETLPVSTPSGLRVVAALGSWAVRP